MDLMLSDCYAQKETPIMFEKPKTNKSYRKKEMLDIDPIEGEETKHTGFDIGDLDEDEQEIRKRAFDASSVLAKIDEASKTLLLPQSNSTIKEDESAETSENKVVFSAEMDLWSLQLAKTVEKFRKPDADVLFEEKKVDIKAEVNSLVEKKVDSEEKEIEAEVMKDNMASVEALHEKPIRCSAEAVSYLRERGFLKSKEVQIERRDESGRDLTQKEAFRQISHRFHGKEPGKKKQEKRMRKNEEEIKIMQMGSSDMPSLKRMKQMQAQQGTPYLLL